MSHTFIATCARGLEPMLADELAALGLDVEPGAGYQAVRFVGDLRAGYRACLWSRIASRVLLHVDTLYAGNVRAFYAELRKVHWNDHLDPKRSLAVTFIGTSKIFRNSHFGALKVKDAIVDHFRDRVGNRPSIDLREPDVRVHVHLRSTKASLSIDLSGDPLHIRGFDREGGPAPLKETLAAGILRFADWHDLGPQGVPFVDPMCGSGTFLMEAADIVRNRAPGLSRRRWGFTGWGGHDAGLWRLLCTEARTLMRRGPMDVLGYDNDPRQVQRARGNLGRAGLAADVRVDVKALDALRVPRDREAEPAGVLVTNPPYGERLGGPAETAALWKQLGDMLRQRCLGYSTWILAGDPKLAKSLGLRPKQRIPLFNGPLEGRLLEVPISRTPVRR